MLTLAGWEVFTRVNTASMGTVHPREMLEGGVECFNPIHEPRKTVDSVLIVLIVVDSVLIVC